ncbi:LLM class F420-dependent oxidoreductase [Amycolatopsis sp. YIM 10]|uniref:LLM class F420-dependent oxidoreductase n=1 Tax=Amycolatopsis sp. YIM 10 TaxID=2653857 RepID=UPI00128FCF20|nr:LLM class F420-dependent oxidoreductase [Amycolatopsis sp. YIM 10]QFU92511.1 Alkanesulfonate monooxygenase [Amycolatopsis sp. YIM 10]
MKFGVSTFLTDESIGPVVLGPALEERGLDALFLAEHTHIPVTAEVPFPGYALPREYFRTLDPVAALTAAAVVTQNLLLGTGIALIVQRDPIITAKEVATLDLFSGGRAVFGVGAGWIVDEMRNHGTDPRTRGRLMDERMRAIIELWTKEKPEFHGEFVDFDPVHSWPKPVQRPHPPIYVGGGSQRAFARLAEYGSAWLPSAVPPQELGAHIDRMRQVTGAQTPVTVFGAEYDPETLASYADLGVERVLLHLPTLPEDKALHTLDEMAEAIAGVSR